MLTRWAYTSQGSVTPGFYIDGHDRVLVLDAYTPSTTLTNPRDYRLATDAELLALRLEGKIKPC